MRSTMILFTKVAFKQQADRQIFRFCLLLLILFPHLVESSNRRNNIQPPTVTHDNNNDNNQHQIRHHHQDSSDQSQDLNRDSARETPDLPYDEVSTASGVPNRYQAPTDLDINRLNDTSVVLKWYLPDDAAHDQLQFFKIQYKSTKKESVWKTENREIPPSIRAYQINGLRPGNYFFIASAVYDNDDNVPSEQFKFKLRAKSKIPAHELPEQKAPEIFWYTATSDYIRFKWKYSFKEKDISYFGYLVYYRSAHAVTDFTIYNTLDENVELAELEPETPYEVKVVAFNQHGVSDFSETKTIRTEAKSNTTTTSTPLSSSASPTRRPTTLDMDSTSGREYSTGQPIFANTTMTTPVFAPTTMKPSFGGTVPTTSTGNPNTIYYSISSAINSIVRGQDDTSLAIRNTMLILIPVLIITFVSVCLIACFNRRKDSPPSSQAPSIQFDLEINGYFKNSFPGVEKEYSPMPNHHAHHGFINNHPHINDSEINAQW